MWKLCALVAVLVFGWVSANDSLVTIGQGQLRGTTLTNTDGREFNAYLGIPYGRIVKRFQEAEPAAKWTGTLDGTKDAPACLQFPTQFHKPLEIFGQEDCLTLNVYTPQNSTSESKYPVLVFFHGGGFTEGQGSLNLYGPQRFMNKDVILVLPNYRVGAFGFLSTGCAASPGNYGLLDQNLALRWIRDNIEKFGGDPSKVTISGESAGGASVTYHLLSPLSKGLFHGAIHQSGSAICPWAKQVSPLEITKNIAKDPMINCPTEDNSKMVECLRNVDAMAIANVTAKSGPSSAAVTSGPVVEVMGSGKFLTEEPLTLLREGRFNKVPVMSAVAEDEATSLFVFLGFIDGSDNYKASEEELKGYINAVAHLKPKDDKNTLNKIMEKYFDGIDYNNSDDVRLRKMKMGSDAYFKSCNDMTMKLLASHDVPVHFYVFNFASHGTAVSNFTGHSDVGHGVVLYYLFNMTVWGPSDYIEEDQRVSDKLVEFWTTFANISKPVEDETKWPAIKETMLVHMDIGHEIKLDENYAQDTSKFWEDIFYPKNDTKITN